AKPAEVVAIALNPRCCKYFALPMSHGFGMAKQPLSCSCRKVCRRSGMLAMIPSLTAADTAATTVATLQSGVGRWLSSSDEIAEGEDGAICAGGGESGPAGGLHALAKTGARSTSPIDDQKSSSDDDPEK